MSEANYKDGNEDGKLTFWYKNGQKELEANYKDGKRDGKYTAWHENGQIEVEANFEDDECVSGDC
jgi:antitoxin component YwqK of YwqJK toxin-antitoxin module